MKTIAEAIRVAGHLLEHNPTTRVRKERVQGRMCYCLVGALSEVSQALGVNDTAAYTAVYVMFKPNLYCTSVVHMWDYTDDAGRLAIARKLQAYSGEE